MELFYSEDISGGRVRLDADESTHCVRVLRHRAGDEISVIDGRGTLLRCILEIADAKGAEARVVEETPGFGAHPYHLTMAVCPTKNLDRYEWFVEKATEIGVDVIAPVIGDRSERRVLKTERLHRLALSAAKQSLKAVVPQIQQVCSVRDFIASAPADALKLICYCFDDVERIPISGVLRSEAAAAANLRFAHPSQPIGWVPPVHETTGGHGFAGSTASDSAEQTIKTGCDQNRIAILIGPEGDFSPEEATLARENGWIPVSLGESRLRTETAAVVAATAVYLSADGEDEKR